MIVLLNMDLNNGLLIKSFEYDNSNLKSINFSPDGLKLAGLSSGNKIMLWNADNGSLIHKFEVPLIDYQVFRFSPDLSSLAIEKGDGTIELFDIANGSLIHTFRGHPKCVTGIAFSRDGTMLASVGVRELLKYGGCRILLQLKRHTEQSRERKC